MPTGASPAGVQPGDEAAAAKNIREMFGRVAPRYDLLNRLLSARIDVYWRNRLVESIRDILARPDARVLDVCCGTGDVALALEKERKKHAGRPLPVLASDFCRPMLAGAQKKLASFHSPLFEGDAMQLGFGPAEATSGAGAAPGFAFATTPDGSLHDHFDYTLLGPDGSDPVEGIYVLQIAFLGESPARSASEPCYVVFNLGLSEEEHELAEQQARWLLACDLDVTGDGTVGGDDLAALLAMWGTDDPAGDLDGDGLVGGSDLSILLGAWGYECP